MRQMLTSEARPAQDRRALAAAAATVLLWASAFVAIRGAGHYFSPGPLAFGRLAIGAVLLGTMLLLRGDGWPRRPAWPGIASAGVLWFGLYMVALNGGEREVDAGTAAMVVNIGPLLIALLSGWLLAEGFPPRLMSGMVVSFLGTIVVGVSMSSGGRASVLGVLLCLIAAMSYAAGVVLQKPALRHASALQVAAFGCIIGAIVCSPFAGQLSEQSQQAPLAATLSVIYLGVFATALAFTTWAYALARTTAGRLGATTYVVPVLVIFMSSAILAEIPGPLTLLGGVLCLAGVALSRSRPREGSGGQ